MLFFRWNSAGHPRSRFKLTLSVPEGMTAEQVAAMVQTYPACTSFEANETINKPVQRIAWTGGSNSVTIFFDPFEEDFGKRSSCPTCSGSREPGSLPYGRAPIEVSP